MFFCIFILFEAMKKSILNLTLILSLVFFSQCDKVKNPIVKNQEAIGSKFITKTNNTVSGFKKVLLEDYTGHQCGNCPAAALVAKNLAYQYKDTLVVIAVHAGFFTKTNNDYPTSYTTTTGNDWDGSSGFGVSSVGNPNGLVNRKNFPGVGLIQKETKWPTSVSLARKDLFNIKLDVTTKYDTTVRALNTDIKATFLSTYSNTIKISVVFVEDGMIGPQKDYSQNPDKVEDYEFDHMLRGAINGSWGDVLKTAPIVANDTVRTAYPNFALATSFNDKKITVVVFVYDAISREILQVEQVKIR